LIDVSFLIVAAGQGNRIGGIPKQFRRLGNIPLWLWSFTAANEMFQADIISECVICVPRGYVEEVSAKTLPFDIPSRVLAGGNSRSDSVRKGLDACNGEIVLIHDAARPFLNPEICRKLIENTTSTQGAIPCLPVTDALKKCENDTLFPVDRKGLHITQTPQSFDRSLLAKILGSRRTFNDEAEAWLGNGKTLSLVKGDPLSFKITFEHDWIHAELLAQGKKDFRQGIGYDIHPLVPGRKLVLGGMEFPCFPLGLKGHSDGDVVIHAIADSILGASGNPDIGTLFPASDPAYKDMDSLDLLRQVASRIFHHGWQIDWLDVVINAQKPYLKDHISTMREVLSPILFPWNNLPEDFSIKAKSGERTGPVGNCECITCTALSSLSRIGGTLSQCR